MEKEGERDRHAEERVRFISRPNMHENTFGMAKTPFLHHLLRLLPAGAPWFTLKCLDVPYVYLSPTASGGRQHRQIYLTATARLRRWTRASFSMHLSPLAQSSVFIPLHHSRLTPARRLLRKEEEAGTEPRRRPPRYRSQKDQQ